MGASTKSSGYQGLNREYTDSPCPLTILDSLLSFIILNRGNNNNIWFHNRAFFSSVHHEIPFFVYLLKVIIKNLSLVAIYQPQHDGLKKLKK